MKVISKIPNERILVSLKQDEFANLLGHYSHFDVKDDFFTKVIREETELDVSDIYRKHRLINSIQKESSYNQARHKLKEILSALEPIEDKIETLSKL